jgi:hypothetical protein
MKLKKPVTAAKLSKKLQQQKDSCLNYFNQLPAIPESVRLWINKRLEYDKNLIKICFGKLLLHQSGDVRQDGLYTGIWDYRLQEITLDLHKAGEDAALEELIFAVRHQHQLAMEEQKALSLLMWEVDAASDKEIEGAVWLFTNRALRDENPLYMGYGYNALSFKDFQDYQLYLKENLLYQNSRIDKALDAYLRRFHSGQFSELLWELKKKVKQSRKLWEKIIQAELKKIYNLSQLDKIIGSLVDDYWEYSREQRYQSSRGYQFQYGAGDREKALKDAAALLGLTLEGVTLELVRKQFRKTVLKSHPDIGGTQEQFIALKEARDQLVKYLNSGQFSGMDRQSAYQA